MYNKANRKAGASSDLGVYASQLGYNLVGFKTK